MFTCATHIMGCGSPPPSFFPGRLSKFRTTLEVYPENNIPAVRAFDVNAGAFIEHINSGALSARRSATAFQRLRVYAACSLSSPPSSSFFKNERWKQESGSPEAKVLRRIPGLCHTRPCSWTPCVLNGSLFSRRRGDVMGYYGILRILWDVGVLWSVAPG